MVTVKIDGIWCKKCRKNHPTLYWHKKYDEYELNRKERWEKVALRIHIDKETYQDNLFVKGLVEVAEPGNCNICGCLTHFKTIETDNFVCGDECKYKELNKEECE